jgi:hypothetical protein
MTAAPHRTDTWSMPGPAASSSRQRLTALRLAAQRIGGGDLASPVDVVRWMLALQGQDLPGAKWAVGLRLAGATEHDVEAAFDAGEIVRSWPLRGTLHVVAAEDLGWLLDLTAPRIVASEAGRRAYLGIEDVDVERAREIVIGVLLGRGVLSREDLLATIAAGGVSVAGQRGYHVLWYLSLTGTLVLGPTEGRQQTFALLDEWVARPRRLEREAALGELALRYFRSHGPATPADLARWSGLTMGDVRRGITIAGDGLTTIEVDGIRYRLAPETLDLAPPAARVHLLPGFDEYLLGYRDRSAALAPEHSDTIVPGGNGVFKPTVLADGEVVGTWTRTQRAHEVRVEARLFAGGRMDFGEELDRAAIRYGTFLGQPARIRMEDAARQADAAS